MDADVVDQYHGALSLEVQLSPSLPQIKDWPSSVRFQAFRQSLERLAVDELASSEQAKPHV